MKAIIQIDVPEYQIGQPVTVYFKDTMKKDGYCQAEAPSDRKPIQADIEGGGSSWWYVCEECHTIVNFRDNYCSECGNRLGWGEL